MSSYEMPAAVEERHELTVEARDILVGDVVAGRAGPPSVVAQVSMGPKYVTARDAEGRIVVRCPADAEVRVDRVEITEESKQARLEAWKNKLIVHRIERARTDVEKAVAAISANAEWVDALWSGMEALAMASADLYWLGRVDRVAETRGVSHVEALELVRKEATRYVLNMSVMRWTSQMSNVLELAKVEAAARLVRDVQF